MIDPAARLAAAGMSVGAIAPKQEMFARASEALASAAGARYGWFVPGRIEVLGKHTDYAGGRSLLAAVERGVVIVAAPRDDDRVIVTDVGRRSQICVTLDPECAVPATGWGNYVATVARRLARNFATARRGADVALGSDLPSSSGMSSSSALLTALLLVLADVNELRGDPVFDRREVLAAYAAAVENGAGFGALAGDRGVGTTGGSEDHTALLCCAAGAVAQYRFCPVRFERAIGVDPRMVFAIGVSGVAASKTGEARDRYNDASAATRLMLKLWCAATGRTDAVLADALSSAPAAADHLREVIRRSGPEPRSAALIARLDQFIEESERIIPSAGDRLAAQDYASFGALVDRSQELAERHLGNQVPETIALARLARQQGALAASAFGAGFGGSVWALVPADGAEPFLEQWSRSYGRACPATPRQPSFFLTRPGPGAVALTPR